MTKNRDALTSAQAFFQKLKSLASRRDFMKRLFGFTVGALFFPAKKVLADGYYNLGSLWKKKAGGSGSGSATTMNTWPAGKVFVWGSNISGQLGLGDIASRSSPVQLGSASTWTQIRVNQDWGAVVDPNGALWTWGDNTNGSLGLGDAVARSSPVQVGGLTDWQSVSVASNFAAIKTDGSLWVWGDNASGGLGLGDTVLRSSPVQVGALKDWKYVYGTDLNQVHAIKTDGTLWAWGYNQSANLGMGDKVYRSSPTQVGALQDWSALCPAGTRNILALKTDASLWAWGVNISGQLGVGDANGRSSPVQVGAATDWKFISCYEQFALGIRTDGTLWTWGNNASGGLGLGDVVARSSPTQLGALKWSRVLATRGSALGIQTDGSLWAWGDNTSGMLGLGDTVLRSSPVQIGSAKTWLNVIGGGNGTASNGIDEGGMGGVSS